MKKVLVIIAVLVAIMAVGWMVFNKPQMIVKPQIEGTQTNLEQELKSTEDDAGAADFKELDKSAEGL